MISRWYRLLLFALTALVPLCQTAAVAEQLPSPQIAIIDVESLMRDSLASRSIRAQLEERRASYQDEISSRERDLRSADQELAKQRSVLSAEAFLEKQQEFQKQVADTQRHVQNRKRQLDQGFAEAMREVEEAISNVAESVAEEIGVNLVLTKNMVIYSVPAVDITEQVLLRLDQTLPSVEVVIHDN